MKKRILACKVVTTFKPSEGLKHKKLLGDGLVREKKTKWLQGSITTARAAFHFGHCISFPCFLWSIAVINYHDQQKTTFFRREVSYSGWCYVLFCHVQSLLIHNRLSCFESHGWIGIGSLEGLHPLWPYPTPRDWHDKRHKSSVQIPVLVPDGLLVLMINASDNCHHNCWFPISDKWDWFFLVFLYWTTL